MDIKPTVVAVKDIVILDKGDGNNVMIQVIGYENATAPLQVPLSLLQSFSNVVLAIDPTLGSSQAPEAVPEVAVSEIASEQVS